VLAIVRRFVENFRPVIFYISTQIVLYYGLVLLIEISPRLLKLFYNLHKSQ